MNKPQNLLSKALLAGAMLLLANFAVQLLILDISLLYWLMLVIPLLLLLPGLQRADNRPLQWLGFLLLFYFTTGVLQVFSTVPAYRWSGIGVVLNSILMFILTIIRIRTIRKGVLDDQAS